MDYKIFIYIISIFATAYALSGLNINGLFKKNKVKEANIMIFLLILAISELVTEFIVNFLEVSKII